MISVIDNDGNEKKIVEIDDIKIEEYTIVKDLEPQKSENLTIENTDIHGYKCLGIDSWYLNGTAATYVNIPMVRYLNGTIYIAIRNLGNIATNNLTVHVLLKYIKNT